MSVDNAANEGRGATQRPIFVDPATNCMCTVDTASGKVMWIVDPTTGRPLENRQVYVDPASGCYCTADFSTGQVSWLIDPTTGRPMSSVLEDSVPDAAVGAAVSEAAEAQPVPLPQNEVAVQSIGATGSDATGESPEINEFLIMEAPKPAGAMQPEGVQMGEETPGTAEPPQLEGDVLPGVGVPGAAAEGPSPSMAQDAAMPVADLHPEGSGQSSEPVQPAEEPPVAAEVQPAESAKPDASAQEAPTAAGADADTDAGAQDTSAPVGAQGTSAPVGAQGVPAASPGGPSSLVGPPLSALAIVSSIVGVAAFLSCFFPQTCVAAVGLALVGLVIALIAVQGIQRGASRGKGLIAVTGVLCVLAALATAFVLMSYGTVFGHSLSEALFGVQPGGMSQANEGSDSMPVGQKVDVGNGLIVSVDKVQVGLKNYDGSDTTCITVTYDNTGTASASYTVYDWKAQDSSGVMHSQSYFSESENALVDGTVSAGERVTGNVYFSGTMSKAYYFSNLSKTESNIGWTF